MLEGDVKTETSLSPPTTLCLATTVPILTKIRITPLASGYYM